jgi:hypothetical protein
LGWAFGILIVLLVAAYFLVTSSGFFKSAILPRVSKALGAEVTVSDASISPFSEVVLRNLKVQTTGPEPLLTATEARARYNLRDILGGNIHVDELTISSPTVVLVENPDGSSNLDPILKAQKAGEKKPEAAPKPAKPLQLDLRKISLSDATIRRIQTDKKGTKDVLEVSHLNATVEGVKNGQTGKLTLSAGIKDEKTSPQPGVAGALEAKVAGDYAFTLLPDLAPSAVKGNTHLDVSRAEGALGELAGGAADLGCEMTPAEIKQLGLRFQRGGTPLGELRVSGPFAMDKKEGKLSVALLSIDKHLLNLAGAKYGVDFGTTTLNSTNQIEIAKAGSVITTVGQVDLGKLQVTRTNETTPTLDFRANYDVTVDLAQSNSLLRSLTLAGTQGGNALLHGELTSPMSISWGKAAGGVGDSTFNFAVTGLNLADWKPFLGGKASAGKLSARAKVLSQQGGDQLTFDVTSQIENLDANLGTNRITQAGVDFQVNGQSSAMKQFNLKSYGLKVTRKSEPLVSLSGSGTYTRGPTDVGDNADMEVTAQAALPRLLELMPQPDMNLAAGTAELKGHMVQKGKTQSFIGTFALNDLTGKLGKNELRSFGTTMDLDVTMTPQQIQMNKVAGKVTVGGQPGGSFDLSGTFNTNKATQVTARLADFNQTGLRPFLKPMLAEKELVSVALNADTSIQYDPQAASALKGNLQVTKLVVSDPKNEFPATPLEARMQFDVSVRQNVTDLRQFQVTLTPTARAKNEVQLTGQIDASHTNAIQGNLKLTAESVDVTSYYDLFVGGGKEAGKQPTAGRATSTAAAPSDANTEPEAHQLPFRNFTADAAVSHFYLREIEVADAHAVVKIDGGHVVVNPLTLALNNSPVNGSVDLDLGVPGYRYDTALSAERIPLMPLVNSFQPERKGQIGGTLTASAGFKGQGTTGASLQKNLSGKFDLSSTNLNLSVVNVKSSMLRALINTVSFLPEMIRNPLSGVTSLLQSMLGKSGGGLADELSKSPITAVSARGQIGAGRVDLTQAQVQSAAFLAEAKGEITLAPVLTNSTLQIPITISLSRQIAQRLNLVATNTPTNAAYAKLDDFVSMKGTIGAAKPDINKLVLARIALHSFGGTGSGEAGQAQGLLQGLGGLLGGKSSNSTNTTPSANQSTNRVGSLLQGLGGLLAPPPAATNAPPNSATNQNQPLNNLLDGLLRPKKQ